MAGDRHQCQHHPNIRTISSHPQMSPLLLPTKAEQKKLLRRSYFKKKKLLILQLLGSISATNIL